MKNIIIILLAGLGLTACAGNPEKEYEARCSKLVGDGRVGGLTQYASGDIEMVRIVIGDKLINKGKITCSKDTLEIIIDEADNTGSPRVQ